MFLSNYLVHVLGVSVAYCQMGIESTFCNRFIFENFVPNISLLLKKNVPTKLLISQRWHISHQI